MFVLKHPSCASMFFVFKMPSPFGSKKRRCLLVFVVPKVRRVWDTSVTKDEKVRFEKVSKKCSGLQSVLERLWGRSGAVRPPSVRRPTVRWRAERAPPSVRRPPNRPLASGASPTVRPPAIRPTSLVLLRRVPTASLSGSWGLRFPRATADGSRLGAMYPEPAVRILRSCRGSCRGKSAV